MKIYNKACEICSETEWSEIYYGLVRDGAFGNFTESAHSIFRCEKCEAARLEEVACKSDTFYTGKDYRYLLQQGAEAEGFWKEHDALQLRKLNILLPHLLRDRIIADIGCAAGSFLDHVRGLAKKCVAVEPCKEYHEVLTAREYDVFSTNREALKIYGGRIEYCFSFSVIEHVLNPLEFLLEIHDLMTPDGTLIISTPNQNDFLKELCGDSYQSFFYRTVHRWYFNEKSILNLVERAGFAVQKIVWHQRFGISNAFGWAKDSRPTGDKHFPHLSDPILNELWKIHLEKEKVADYMFVFLKRVQ